MTVAPGRPGPSVSLVIPVYDEIESLPGLLDEIADFSA